MYSLNAKKIIFVRHAKALSREKWEGEDFDRTLSPFGRDSARVLGQYLRIIGAVPDRIVSSPAARTLETADIIMARIGSIPFAEHIPLWGIEWTKEAKSVYTELIQSQDDDIGSLLIVWHNPDISEMLRYFTHETTPSLKPGAIAILATRKNMRWKDIGAGNSTLIHYSTPEFFHFDYIGSDE